MAAPQLGGICDGAGGPSWAGHPHTPGEEEEEEEAAAAMLHLVPRGCFSLAGGNPGGNSGMPCSWGQALALLGTFWKKAVFWGGFQAAGVLQEALGARRALLVFSPSPCWSPALPLVCFLGA